MTTTELSHRTTRPTRRLRILLTVNGVSNLAGGAVLLPLAGTLTPPTGLSPGRWVGISAFYLLYGAAMWFAATRPRPRRAVILTLIAVNLVWAADCLLMLGAGLAHPTTLGSVLLGAEAVTVTVTAALEYAAYRGGERRPGLAG